MKTAILLGALFLSGPVFAKDCMAPWGEKVKNGKAVLAWNFSRAPKNVRCESQARLCRNGELLGVFMYPDCIEIPFSLSQK